MGSVNKRNKKKINLFLLYMKVACDLYTSSIKFQIITKKIIRKLKKNFKDIELINVQSKKFKKNKSKIKIYWGNRISAKIIQELPKLEWIHYGSTGVNVEVLKLAKTKKIQITNTRRMFDNAVAATVMSFIFTLARGINYSFYLKSKKKLNRKFYNKITPNIKNVFNQKILFVGFGGIAKKISKICKSMDMEIYGIKRKNEKFLSYIKFYRLKEIKKAVQNKDYVINLLPFTYNTKKIFNKEIFDNMKKSAFFINVGRGETVEEKDLIEVLKNKKISGAALDVVQNEPIKKNSQFLKLNNLIITPHIAGITNDYWDKQYQLFSKNFKNFKTSKKLQNIVRSEIGY